MDEGRLAEAEQLHQRDFEDSNSFLRPEYDETPRAAERPSDVHTR